MASKKISNKGSISFNMLKAGFIYLMFAIIVIFSVIFLNRSFYTQKMDTFNIESDMFVNRLILSPNTFTYVDSITNRAYPGVIDFNKLNNIKTILEKSIFYGDNKRYLSARITITGPGGVGVYGLDNPIFYFHKEVYEELAPLRNIRGLGASFGKTYNYKMLLQKDTKKIPITMEVDVLIPRS